MRLNATMTVNLRTKEVATMGQGCAREFASIMGDLVKIQAQKNVAPGKGPGPHPHRPPPFREHVDTGDLMRSIEKKMVHQGFMETAYVYTDLEYGLFLEMGWTSQAGRHWRYPWLYPAFMQVQALTADIIGSTAKRWFSDTGRMYKGSQIITSSVSGTAWPE